MGAFHSVLAPFPLFFPGKQVGVVLKAVHVRQQQLCRLQRHHVLQVIVLVPGGEDIRMDGTGMQRDSGSGGGWREGKVRKERDGGTGRKSSVV